MFDSIGRKMEEPPSIFDRFGRNFVELFSYVPSNGLWVPIFILHLRIVQALTRGKSDDGSQLKTPCEH